MGEREGPEDGRCVETVERIVGASVYAGCCIECGTCEIRWFWQYPLDSIMSTTYHQNTSHVDFSTSVDVAANHVGAPKEVYIHVRDITVATILQGLGKQILPALLLLDLGSTLATNGVPGSDMGKKESTFGVATPAKYRKP